MKVNTPVSYVKRFVPLLSLASFLLPASRVHAFGHPGMLHTSADFSRMVSKVTAGTEPQTSGWNKLLANTHSSSSYTLQGPLSIVYRGYDGVRAENYSKLFNDIAAAY